MSGLYLTQDGSITEEPDESSEQLVTSEQREQLSKTMSYLLRHDESFITENSYGWVKLETLLQKLSTELSFDVSEKMVSGVVEASEKDRFELKSGEIRARYGHSVNVLVEEDPVQFTGNTTLYHGTPKSNVDSILEEGLRSQNRTHVHLTDTLQTAIETGQRHRSEPIAVFEINADKLQQEFDIYNPSGSTFIVKKVSPIYLEDYSLYD